jgi:hypothetical protein
MKSILISAVLGLFIIPFPLFAGYTGDLNYDGIVDYADFSIFASNWLKDINVPVSIVKIELDSDPDWTTEGQWQFGTPMGMGGSSYGYADPNNGYTGTNVYAVNLNGDYNVAVGGPYYLTTGPFNCAQSYDTKLKFARWLNTDDPNYVKSKVEVSNNGGSWDTVWENTSSVADSEWQIVEYDVNDTADNGAVVFFRWSYEILDNRAYPYSGWNIDDIEILGKQFDIEEEHLMMSLMRIRSAISSYRAEHYMLIPGEIWDPDTGVVTDATGATFVLALCSKTDRFGNIGTIPGVHVFGPYMNKIPVNPFSNVEEVVTVSELAEDGASISCGSTKLTTANESTGWYLTINGGSTQHGYFQANDGLANPVTGELHVNY